jgi:1-acyl-sn-glycerol-3-phosphate acyltransferase
MLQEIWYEFVKDTAFLAAWLAMSLRVEGRRFVPSSGPALLIANHQSFLDPALIAVATTRHLQFLARKGLFRIPLFGRLIASVNSVPVDQEGVAKEGLKTILELLKQGKAVLIFPEGERSFTGTMQPLKPGVMLLIQRSQAPIIPVGVAGAFNLFPRQHKLPRLAPLFLPAPQGGVAVSFGKPLDPRRFTEMPRAQALAELFDQIQAVQLQAEKLRRKR